MGSIRDDEREKFEQNAPKIVPAETPDILNQVHEIKLKIITLLETQEKIVHN